MCIYIFEYACTALYENALDFYFHSFEATYLYADYIILFLFAVLVWKSSSFCVISWMFVSLCHVGGAACVPVSSHTHSLCPCVSCSCLSCSALNRTYSWNDTSEPSPIKWCVYVNVEFYSKIMHNSHINVIWREWSARKLSHCFWQGAHFLGEQTGICVGDTGESQTISVEVRINQIPFHEINLNAEFSPQTPEAIY